MYFTKKKNYSRRRRPQPDLINPRQYLCHKRKCFVSHHSLVEFYNKSYANKSYCMSDPCALMFKQTSFALDQFLNVNVRLVQAYS